MSILARLKQDGSNAISDAYSAFILGEDAGKSARIPFVLRPDPNTKRLVLGMTFIEINGRAHVRTVDPDSEAAKAGVLPRDAVQFAAVYEQVDVMDNDAASVNGESSVSATSTTAAKRYLQEYAMECEAKGMRISYDDLKRMLRDGMEPHSQSAFVSPATSNKTGKRHYSHHNINSKPIPKIINLTTSTCGTGSSVLMDDIDRKPLSPFSTKTPKPVVFVFRRTRQRPNTLWNFRLDDECDFSSSLIRRLAPTSDMDMPLPDTWEELVHDGTDWLLGNGSILPPKNTSSLPRKSNSAQQQENAIPLDDYERTRAAKLAHLRSRMAAETLPSDRAEDVEAATLRGMIQKAVGLAFVRASKVVLGVSVHGGSGIVIARLPDGTWSAPSAIGTWGLGLGVQFGLEVAEYIFILQTQESLDHFRRGTSFTVGGNIGAAIAGMGREAYGAASVGHGCGGGAAALADLKRYKEDEYDDDESDSKNRQNSSLGIAPIVAYAKSQGLYIGVSLEGSRIFTRDDINARAYKFATGREVTANDILSGKVATPPEAEDLYASLHSVEFTHEMSCLPRPPEVLRRDSPNSWYYDRSTLSRGGKNSNPFSFLNDLSKDEAEECAMFETQFKKFMYGGVSVQRLLPNSELRSGKSGKERRTLWLMLPEVGALRLGFVSKLSDNEGALVSNKSSTQKAKRDQPSDMSVGDLGTVASEELTLDSGLIERESSMGHIRTGNVQLSNKHSVALSDVTVLSQEPHIPVQFSSDDQTEHLRVISIQEVSGTSLLFLANNFREAELLVCGLKLLLEQETSRLGVRGGLPITALGGKAGDLAMSPTAARGFKDAPMVPVNKSGQNRRKKRSSGSEPTGYSSSEVEVDDEAASALKLSPRHQVPEGRPSWGQVPGRDYLRNQAAGASASLDGISLDPNGVPKFVHGQLIVREIASHVQLPLPLPLCRVLLLDSTSPVITKWERDRGDSNFSKTDWTFPPATPRELERHDSEHQLIASGSMMGAHRTTTFDRPRNGTMTRLSETQIIDADDSETLAFTISERNPRRGFSVKVRIVLYASKDNFCEATVLGEVRPVVKNMSNQAAVNKAFNLVLNEISSRYGVEGNGLMAGFLTVVNSLPNSEIRKGRSSSKSSSPSGSKDVSFSAFPSTSPRTPSSSRLDPSTPPRNGYQSGLVSLDEMMRKERMRPSTPVIGRTPPPGTEGSGSRSSSIKKDIDTGFPADEMPSTNSSVKPKTIEVKPLPKIRLSLMPSPREEDEDKEESSHERPKDLRKKKKKQSSIASPRTPSATQSGTFRS
ncbi:Las17-binding protein actin regulator [Fragilaria crotonensis]|nr:Las17-binding protein actin regulator [Fragilaria crotonensis]